MYYCFHDNHILVLVFIYTEPKKSYVGISKSFTYKHSNFKNNYRKDIFLSITTF